MSILLAVAGCIAASAQSHGTVVANPITGIDITNTSPANPTGASTASVRWNSAGDGGPGWAGATNIFAPAVYKWLENGSPGDFQIFFMQASGDPVSGSALNQWLPLGVAQSLVISVGATNASARRSAVGSYMIRRASTSEVVGNNGWSLEANVVYISG